MKMLRKTIKAIVVIVLLKAVTVILDRYSPESTVFHRQFLFSMQILVIVWLLLTLLLFAIKAGRSWVARFLPVLIVMVVLLFDIIFSFGIENPSKIPTFLRKEFKDYYAAFERNIMEFEPCSIYDSTYGFRIIPGLAYSYGNIEYRNNYVVNSESLRDEEQALTGPQIISVGSAYTIGVGVDSQQTYSSVLEKEINLPVLNTGNPTYGTYREMRRVLSSDTSDLKYIVVQYSKYDVYENTAFINSKQPFRVRSDSAYKLARAEYRWRREYFPGKYAITISYNWAKGIFNKLRKDRYFPSGDAPLSAEYFLKVLNKMKPPAQAKIIVTEINDFPDMNSGFLPAVDSLLQKPEYASLKGVITTVSVADQITRDDYYIIDANLKSSGHLKVGKRIAEVIRQDSTVTNK